ncbi:hypothetical protein cypCar_00025929 [Cyprinus carpio]|nr:hypothetical protein cypCar_00025929 [Cyprinus carpio]
MQSEDKCITLRHTIKSGDCGSKTFRCRLKNPVLQGFTYSSKNVIVNKVNEVFSCKDGTLGDGKEGDTLTGPCEKGKEGTIKYRCISALTIVAINLVVLIVVLYKILWRGVGAATQPDEKHALVVIARCVAILTPIFCLTWGFGIGTMVSQELGIHVVFALLNSLQGFFILVFGTLLDSKV